MQKHSRLSLESFTKMHGGINSIGNTLYWMEAALEVHRNEFSAESDVLAALNRGGVDLLVRMDRILKDVRELVKELRSTPATSDDAYRHLFDGTKFEDLSPTELDRLAEINTRLDEVGEHIVSVKGPIEFSLEETLNDPADRLHDYELEVDLQFERSESDPGYVDGGDPTVSSVALMKSGLGPDAQWPQGYDQTLPFPHGGIFHQLRLYGNAGMNRLDYRDILKIGVVWVDVKVTYQYLFDLATGQWIKDDDCEPRPLGSPG